MKSIAITLSAVLWGMLIHAQSNVNYTFDKHGRLASEHYESVYLVQFTYDKEGNLQSKTVANYTNINDLKEQISDTGIKLFPNPAYDHVVIEVPDGISISTINMTDITGKVLMQIKKPEVPVVLQIADLKSGLYFIKIESEGKKDVFKFIKE